MPQTVVSSVPDGPARTFTESLPVTQSKLSLGFRTGVTGSHAAYPAMMLFNCIFGGGVQSKLFRQVREAQSLCYYASSTLEKQKGVLAVASGIASESFDAAREEILRQLSETQQGHITAGELDAARRTVLAGLRVSQDSPAALENFWLSQNLLGLTWGLETLQEKIAAVTLDEVVDAANRVRLDAVYFLKGGAS